MTLRTREDLRLFVRADLVANGLPQQWRARYRLTHRIAYYQWLLRRSEYWDVQRGPFAAAVSLVLKLRVHLLGERLGFDLPRHVFGPGLSIAHKGTVVVSPGARVGRNCRLHQGVTIGQVHDRFPIVGDDVWIATGAVVLGGVTVGDGAAVAANAVVTSDVPPDTTVGGVPARSLGGRGSSEWMRDACAEVEGLGPSPRRAHAATSQPEHEPAAAPEV